MLREGRDYELTNSFNRSVNYLKGKITVLSVAHKVPRCLQIDCSVQLR